MERIVALVEGHLETHFVNSSYANAIVQRPFPNGDDVDLDLIIESINDQLETVGGDISKVVIMMDREGRDQSAKDIASHVGDGVSKANPNRSIYVGVSDREIENWILADEELMASSFSLKSYKYKYEGNKGKSILRDISGGVDLGYRDKAKILKSCVASRVASNSSSFEQFQSSFDFEWWWISR